MPSNRATHNCDGYEFTHELRADSEARRQNWPVVAMVVAHNGVSVPDGQRHES
jgi:hypothetical protein